MSRTRGPPVEPSPRSCGDGRRGIATGFFSCRATFGGARPWIASWTGAARRRTFWLARTTGRPDAGRLWRFPRRSHGATALSICYSRRERSSSACGRRRDLRAASRATPWRCARSGDPVRCRRGHGAAMPGARVGDRPTRSRSGSPPPDSRTSSRSRTLDGYRELGLPPYPRALDRVAFVRAWKRKAPGERLPSAQVRSWVGSIGG